ncbi:MAG: helix-turn-helix domain-containing protein [Sphaerochaetaceae bacterium]
MSNTILISQEALAKVINATTQYQNAVNELLSSIQRVESSKDVWITSKEVQKITGISKEKLARMARLNECVAKRVGKDWRFPRAKVEDMSFIHENNTADSR